MNRDSAGPRPDGATGRNPAAWRGLWPWFAAGFLLVFVGMAFGVRMATLNSRGDRVIEGPLWLYYSIEARRVLDGSGALGPTSGSTATAIATAAQHVFCSCLGGAAMSAIGWAARSIRARRRSTASGG
jgi:hypothetical protein